MFKRKLLVNYDLIVKGYILLFCFYPFFNTQIWIINTSLILSVILLGLNVVLHRKVIVTKFVLGYSLFVALSIISVFWSADKSSYIYSIRNILNYLLILFNLTQVSDEKNLNLSIEERIQTIIKVYLFGLVILTLYCYIDDNVSLLKWARLGRNFFEEAGLNQIYFSLFLIIGECFAIFKLINEWKDHKIFNLLITLFLFISCVLTGIRKTVVVPFIFLYVFLISKNRRNILKIVKVTLLVLGLAVLIILLAMRYSTSFSYRIVQLIDTFKGTDTAEASYASRKVLASLAISAFIANPILGLGSGQFVNYAREHSGINLYSHKNWTEILANLGIVGFLIYYGNHLMALLQIMKEPNDDYSNMGISLIITFFIVDYYQVSYYYEYYAIAFSIVALVAFRKYKSYRVKNKS